MFAVQKQAIYNLIHFLNKYFITKYLLGYVIWTETKFT